MSFYAVANGKQNGIYQSWEDCKLQVIGFKGAIYKKFKTKQEAQNFIKENTIQSIDDNNIDYYLYTDGACSNNGSKDAIAGIGIYFGPNDKRNVSKRINGKQTNNTAELEAIINTYEIIEKDYNDGKIITIVSDSEYAIRCATSYGEKISKAQFKTKGKYIPNHELVKRVYELYHNKNNIKFKHCRAHTNNKDIHSIGNDGADKLANKAIGLEACPYSFFK